MSKRIHRHPPHRAATTSRAGATRRVCVAGAALAGVAVTFTGAMGPASPSVGETSPDLGAIAMTSAPVRDISSLLAERQLDSISRAARRAEVRQQAQAAAVRRERAARRALNNAQQDPRAAGRALVAEFGFGDSEFDCLDALYTGESNWRWDADNPASSAYGIPQALPGSKMASAGADWETNPVTQIRWGLGYIRDRYGSPCAAWGFKQGNGWY